MAASRMWRTAPGVGWQHGKPPSPPTGLTAESRRTWATWMASWQASLWEAGDLPGLRVTIRLFDQVQREPQAALHSELRHWMTMYGISPAGVQQRHWRQADPGEARAATGPSPYGHLRVAR